MSQYFHLASNLKVLLFLFMDGYSIKLAVPKE